MVKIAQFFMSQKFEKPVKWEHFDRFLRITLYMIALNRSKNSCIVILSIFSFPEHIHLIYFKIFGFFDFGAPLAKSPTLDHSMLAQWLLARHQFFELP